MTRRRLSPALWLLGLLMLACATHAFATPSVEAGPARLAAASTSPDLIRLAQTQPTDTPAPAPPTSPDATASPAGEPIGNVVTLTGSATVTRNNTATPLQLQDDIFQGDILHTQENSTLGVTFSDSTTFNLTANATVTLDFFVYENGGKQNGALIDIARGTVAFVAAAVAKTGDMRISTPSATLGIRGTTGLIEVPQDASATNAGNVAIKLYPDADGKVGRIEVNSHDGTQLGLLTRASSGFTLRPGAMGRFAAVPLVISPRQALRDQGIVRQLHATQSVGREIVTQRRIQRQNPNQTPARPNPPATPPAQPGPQQPNGRRPGQLQRPVVPKQPGVPQRPGTPHPTGSPREPGSLHEPALPNRAGQPQLQPPPGAKPGPAAPVVQRPALQNRPAPPPRRPAPPIAPKGKPKEEKR